MPDTRAVIFVLEAYVVMNTVALSLSAGGTMMVSSFCRLRTPALSALVILCLGSLAHLTVYTTSFLSSAAG